ncbi:penicillin-binding protein 1C [Cognatishimia sp. MH4019]|uniref:penicillin-binding protein 1C n=1 Tax=Cognatishimia sp. MH4019 TaxID=2854030 RepID=UPI001CD3D25D|nr:penicillin-binding protein 1C [Cognatishimia sp. MH4019]
MTRGLLLFALTLYLAALGRDRVDLWVDQTVLPPLALDTSTEMRDRTGTLLRAYTVEDGLWRLNTPLDVVDPDYIDMLIAYEDKRFRTHSGVDPLAMVRAAGQALWHGEVISGASTLTMQTARLLEQSGTGAWSGKLRQIRVALALERRLSKDDILALYLNRAPFGGNIEGLRSASLAYFAKEPKRLTDAEAALLVALPQAPEARRPDRAPIAAAQARERVLARAPISDGARRAALSEPVPTIRRTIPQIAPHLTDRLRVQAPFSRTHHLTLDAALQQRLTILARKALRGHDPRMSIAILAADHRTGEVLASVGSAGYTAHGRAGFVDMTQAIRSPGSTLKPLIYGMAFDNGLAHPETLIADRPTQFGTYAPQNFDGLYRGELRVRDALQLSLNIPVVALSERLGPNRIYAKMRLAGMRPDLPGTSPGLALSLGGVGVSLNDLVQLYAGFAQGGQAPALQVKTDTNPAQKARILNSEAAWHVSHILAGLRPPTGQEAGQIAFKTGTSYGHRDAWAIGYDGAHVIGVWMGRPDGTPVPGAFGGDLAAPILFEAFDHITPGRTALPPPPPATLIVSSAQLPAPLQRFDRAPLRNNAPVVAFPPDGAVLEDAETLTLKIREGHAPFTVLLNGKPVRAGAHDRDIQIAGVGRGAATLSVIDARGQSARTQVWLD